MTLKEKLAALIAEGLTFGECVTAFATQEGYSEPETVARAKEEYHRDGEIEIDDYAVVSRGEDNGAYVMAWVWVDDPDENEGGG